jgi:hypothetical protein
MRDGVVGQQGLGYALHEQGGDDPGDEGVLSNVADLRSTWWALFAAGVAVPTPVAGAVVAPV